MSSVAVPLRVPAARSRRVLGLTGAALVAIGLPCVLFLVQAAWLGGWLIDDAGITFAYARNLASGHGLVAQPGQVPVEGFSDPLWMLVIAALFRMGLFDLPAAPKLLSFALVAASFALLARDLDRPGGPRWPAALGPALLASSAPFVIWTSSGLENPLLAALAALSCGLTARALAGERRRDTAVGLTAALLALTRPEAVLYAAVLPAGLLLMRPSGGSRVWLHRTGAHLAGLLPPLAGYLGFRRLYFGDWVPNTYHAKDHPALAFLLDREKWLGLLDGTLGPLGLPVTLALAIGLVVLARRGELGARGLSLALHLGVAAVSYVLLPEDWMGEYRFATPFILFLCWSLAEAVRVVHGDGRSGRRLAAAGLALGLAAGSAAVHGPRLGEFAARPVVPLESVARYYGHGYNRLADVLDLRGASLLAPDMGGTLLVSQLAVTDLVGLCDRTTARALRSDTTAFHRHVFEVVRPTFIHVHGAWSGWASLHAAPALGTEYVAIRETWQGESEPVWADYVRRDALGADPDTALQRLRQAYLAMGMDRLSF
jgi:hypothetical protein